MKFKVIAENLVKAKNKIKKIVQDSSLVKKTIYLECGEDLVIYGYSEGFYGEIHVPAQIIEPGLIELNYKSLDVFEFAENGVEFELLPPNQLGYKCSNMDGKINIVSSEPSFKATPHPTEWITLSTTFFDVLYCNTKDDINLENVFFFGDKIATTSQYAFAAYKHSKEITSEPFTVPIRLFDLVDKSEDIEFAIDLRKVWAKRGNFFVSASTFDYQNKTVTQYSYYEFEPKAFFEITLEEAKRVYGYIMSLSETGWASLVLHNSKLFIIPTGDVIGPGTMELKPLKSEGEINYGLRAINLLNAANHVDHGICRVCLDEPQPGFFSLIVVGNKTRHLFNEIPAARYNGESLS